MKGEEINLHLKRIVNTINDALMIVGIDGTIIMVNEAFEAMTGYRSDEVVGKGCSLLHCDACELKLPEDRHWCRLFDARQEIRCRCHVMKKDGSCLPVRKNASVLEDAQGNPLGAVETLTDLSELDRLDRETVRLSQQLHEQEGFHGIVGNSPSMQRLVEIIQKSSQNDCPVIIYGESGTGKELVAKAIHSAGTRKDGPFVQLNCGALNESMLEIELFGHIRGAFAAAGRHRTGSFEAADGGDIFLDDIADVSLSIQNKLLRLLENRQFERLGDHRPVTADVRIISATSRNLKRQIQQGLFREDLFFRINVIPIHLPPLRERKEDIPLLVSTFMKPLRLHTGKQISRLSPAAMAKLMDHAWPGNVRELKSTLQYAFVVAEHDHILPEHLPPTISGNSRQCPPTRIFEPPGSEAMETTEKESLIEALRRTGGNQSKAARLLSVSRVTVWNRMKKYGIDLKKILVM